MISTSSAARRRRRKNFLHTFNSLLADGRQIVVTCDCHPRLTEEFLPELADRLLGGAVWGLQPPDASTRLDLLRSKAAKLNALIDEKVLKFLADQLRGNVRELEGALNSLRHFAKVTGRLVDIPLAREALGDLLRHAVRVVTLADIDAAVCQVLRLPAGTLQSKARGWSVSHPHAGRLPGPQTLRRVLRRDRPILRGQKSTRRPWPRKRKCGNGWPATNRCP